MLQQAFDRLDEGGGVIAVDDPVIEGGGEVHHLAHHDLAAADHRPLDDLVGADDGDLRMVDHRRRGDAAQGPEAGDGDGRAAEFLGASALPSRAAAARRAISAAQSQRSQRLGMAHDRHDQAAGRLGGDADMHGRVAMDDAGLVVEARR